MNATTKTTAIDFARSAGAQLASQIREQGGDPALGFGSLDAEDWREMRRVFGEVTPEMEAAYKDGFESE